MAEVTFSLPVPINEDPNVAVCTCQDCGAAILIVDFVGDDAKKIHEAWHRATTGNRNALPIYSRDDRDSASSGCKILGNQD